MRGWRMAAATLAAVLACGVPFATARAAVLWTLTATPLSVGTGTTTTFTLTATNEDPMAAVLRESEIGCVALEVPANFVVHDADVTGSNSGDSWAAELDGNRVTVAADSGGDRLELLGWVRFSVVATAKSAGSLTWAATAYADKDCTGTSSLLGVPPIVVVVGAAVTPTPTPAPVPTTPPTSKPIPTPTPPPPMPAPPTPALTAPPSTPAAGTPTPPAPSAVPTPTRAPSPAATPVPERQEPAAAPPGRGEDDDPPAGRAPTLPRVPQLRVGSQPGSGDAGIQLAPFATLAVSQAWIVPAVALGGPGLLVILVIGLQLAGALAWLPAVRRLRGD